MEAIIDYFAAGGWLMYPLVTVTFLIWFLYFTLLVDLKEKLQTPDLCDLDLPDKCNDESGRREIEKKLRGETGAVPFLTIGCLSGIRAGLPFREAFMQCRHRLVNRYTYSFYMFGAMVTAAPLLGLLGTVLGMIQTFEGVGVKAIDPTGQIAGGISQALITTQLGLAAALPGTLGLVHLFRLYRRLQNTADQCESHLALKMEFS